MPDLSHLWQRFLLASALLVGVLIGAAATVFGYSNLTTVDVHWSIFQIGGVPLWTVAVVPLALVLVAGTLYHWYDSLHHFTEHMRHRRRVHELEVEVKSLRAHLDQALKMPDQSAGGAPRKPVTAEPLPEVVEKRAPALPESTAEAVSNGVESNHPSRRSSRHKRAMLALAAEPAEPAAASTNGGQETAPVEPKP
ncbi:MAG: hypothetical protein M3R21_06370 [Candidatus Dormibacteraeota bacterium]|nr:hypothetical protein [Candidatus Dormibacteraeota bacterium]